MLLVFILRALHVAQMTELLSVCLLNGKTLRRQRAIQPTLVAERPKRSTAKRTTLVGTADFDTNNHNYCARR